MQWDIRDRMTRIHNGSPLPPLQPETNVQGAGASDRTSQAARLAPGGSDEPPVRDVLVSYDDFKQRRQLRRRVIAAFEKLEQARTLDGECRVVPHVPPATDDETP
jgi:hypothetical protein